MIKRKQWAILMSEINEGTAEKVGQDIANKLYWGWEFHGPSKIILMPNGSLQYAQEFTRDVYGL